MCHACCCSVPPNLPIGTASGVLLHAGSHALCRSCLCRKATLTQALEAVQRTLCADDAPVWCTAQVLLLSVALLTQHRVPARGLAIAQEAAHAICGPVKGNEWHHGGGESEKASAQHAPSSAIATDPPLPPPDHGCCAPSYSGRGRLALRYTAPGSGVRPPSPLS